MWLWQRQPCLREQSMSLGRTKAAATVLAGATSEFRSEQGSGGGALR